MEKSKNRTCKFSMLIAPANGGVLGLIPRTSARNVECVRESGFAKRKMQLKVSNSKKSEDMAWSKYWLLPVYSQDADGVYRNQSYQRKPLDGSDLNAKHLAFYGW